MEVHASFALPLKITDGPVKVAWVRVAGRVQRAAVMQRGLLWGLLASAIVTSYPFAARAEDDPAVRDAQARFEEGLERVKAGDIEGARLSFAQAYAALKRPAILWNLALTEEKTGRLVEALAHFKRVARDTTASSGDREEAQRHAAALSGRTGHIDVQAPAGATLRVDGEAAESPAPLSEPIDVVPGRHSVEARLGAGVKVVSIDAAAGQVAHVTVSSADLSPASAAVVTSAPGVGPVDSGAGTGRLPEPGASTTPPARIITVTVLGGAALITTGLGIYFALQSKDDETTAAGYRARTTGTISSCHGAAGSTPDCGSLAYWVHRQDRDATWSNVMYVAAGAFAAGAIITWFAWPRGERATSSWVAPIVTRDSLGLAAAGTF